MTQPTHQKFVFDTVFGDEGDVIAHTPRPRRVIPAEEVDALCAEAYARGEQSAVAAAEAVAAQALQQIAAMIGQAMPTLVEVAHDHRVGSAELALAAARKIADAALDQFPEAAVQAALVSLAREVEAVPRLLVHAPADLAERLQGALETTANAVGYPGQIVVKASAGMGPASFIYDWGDGRAAFDPEAAAARVAEALQTALAAEGLHAEPLLPPERAD
jgi:flagellar assembly protein FliH